MEREIELAWAAGFFDGEGSIGAVMDQRAGRRIGIDMTVVQTGPETTPPAALLRFKDAVGGHGQIQRRQRDGRFPGHKPQWSWRCGHADNVMEIVRSLLPYLTVKLDQVAEAVAIRTEYVELLKERKRFCKRGHDLKDTAYPNNQTRANCRECNRTRQAEWRSAQKGG